jgi:uncharacterized protein (UPF0216 family)
MSKKLIEGLWKTETEKLASSLPKTRKSLAGLIETPNFILGDGQNSEVTQSDLEYLCELIPESLWKDFHLPIIFQKRKQIYTLLGDITEKWIVEKILELTNTSPFLLEVFKPREYYFAYHYQRVQKIVPTVVFLTIAIDP